MSIQGSSESLYTNKGDRDRASKGKEKAEQSEWPKITPGGSLLLAWQLADRRVLIVGGGNVAADRLRSVLSTGSRVTLVCPQEGLGEEARYRVVDEQEVWKVDWRNRGFVDEDITNEEWDMVLTALDDPDLSKHIHSLCKKRRFNVNVADVPPLCDFYFGSVIRRGPLQVMISTNGKGPRLANRIRRGIEDSLPENVGEAIENIGELRKGLRKNKSDSKDPDSVRKRMEFMVNLTDAWSLDELCALNGNKSKQDGHTEERAYDKLLEGFEADYAMSYTTLSRAYWRRLPCPYWWLQAVNPVAWWKGITGTQMMEARKRCPVFQAKKDMVSKDGATSGWLMLYAGLMGSLVGGGVVLAAQRLIIHHRHR